LLCGERGYQAEAACAQDMNSIYLFRLPNPAECAGQGQGGQRKFLIAGSPFLGPSIATAAWME
jgi:hypothetical protein